MRSKQPPRAHSPESLKRPSAPRPAPPRERLAEDAADEGGLLVRLNKYLADHGVASRRKCDELIQSGKVTVDGEPAVELGTKIDPDRQVVEIDGYFLKPRGVRKRYYVLNKPAGVVCTNDERETRPRAVDLVTDPGKGRIYTVGRLDEESKGLILLTNDGDFANKIMHPRFGIAKTYVVKISGRIEDDALQQIREGVHLAEGRTSGARLLVLKRERDHSIVSITIHEGMNREIRRVFARVGSKVTDLRRVRIGPLTDRGVKPGRWRELLSSEVRALLAGDEPAEEAPRQKRGSKRALPLGKRFPKKQGYARHLLRAGKPIPGVERTSAPSRGADSDGRGAGASFRGSGTQTRDTGKPMRGSESTMRGARAPFRGSSSPSRGPKSSMRTSDSTSRGGKSSSRGPGSPARSGSTSSRDAGSPVRGAHPIARKRSTK